MKLTVLSIALGVTLAATGCVADISDDELNDAEIVDQTEDELLKKTRSTSSWSYRGLMPRLESPEMTVSLEGHTVHVTGLLPTSHRAQLPFHARTEQVGGRTRVHVVYPIATVDPESRLPNGLIARNPEPFRYTVCGGSNFKASNDVGAFGGFPFIEYVCRHRDSDGRIRGGIAFHGPITSTPIGGSRYWSLLRGPVSHACNRMMGEHVLELARVIGFDKGARGIPVTVIADFDRLNGKIVDVDYPSFEWTRPSASSSTVFPIWQAVKTRPDGTTALDFPQWACETSRCASMPPNARDPYTGRDL